MTKIQIGQIWQDWDVRFRGQTPRFIKVIKFINDLYVQVENTTTFRKTTIAMRRFRPNSNGYKLREDIK